MLVFLLLSMSCVGSTATAFTSASVLCRAGPNTRGGTYLRMEEPRPWPKMGATWPWQRTAGRGAGSARLAAMDAQLQDGVIRHGRFRCAYRFKAPAPGHELDAPLVLVHPVGIGLSSWFWDRFIGEWRGGAVFTIDLIGCGDSDPWEPADQGMFVPLDWVRAIEALWREQIGRKCVVVVQGGLAPVGVQLAARRTSDFNGADAVGGLVLASPPTFEAMRQGLDQEQVAKNWRWLTSPPGQASYYLLRLRAFVSFFSNLFLFRDRADEEFVQRACRGATIEARWPVFAFNSGLVIAKGFADEIETIAGEGLKVMILSGSDDGRTAKREASALSLIPSCQLVRIAGKNVLPWESARDTAAAILDMAQTITA